MAKRKETIWQRDFWLGSTRPEAVERDDSPLVTAALKECLNTISLTTGQCESRPGTIHLGTALGDNGFEVVLGEAATYSLIINDDGMTLYDEDGAVVHDETGVDWTALDDVYGSPTYSDIQFWVLPDPDTATIIIGSNYFPLQALVYNGSSWVFGLFEFSESEAGAKNISFWRHYPSVRVRPSGRTGTITVTATSGIWTTGHEGIVIRYVDRQILLTTRVSATVMNATVIEELPPTLSITVASGSGFQIGDAVEAAVSGGQGVVTNVSGTTITVLVTKNYSGFNTGEALVGPNAKSNMSAVSAAGSLATSYLWDMQMWNPVHGYPGTAARHGGRMFLADFLAIPAAFAASTAGDIADFSMGANDADGFADSLGAGTGGHLKHILSAEDLLFFTTRGLYFQTTRDGSAITPTNIAPIRFSRFGSSDVPPVAVDDGAVFVDPSGKQIHAAVLAGDIYRSWRVEQISKFAPHVIDTPIKVGATESGSERPELFIFALLQSGDMAVCQWDRDDNRVSWRLWTTDGTFKEIFQSHGKMHTVVDRTIDGSSAKFHERFEYGAVLDCMAAAYVTASYPTGATGVDYLSYPTKAATHLEGHECQVYFEGFDMGDHEISASGLPLEDGSNMEYPDGNVGFAQIGLQFPISIIPWSRRSVDTQRGIREVKRLIQMYVTVQSTGVFEIDGRSYGDYFVGEDLTVPPPLRDIQVRMSFLGASAFEEIEITRDRPGPLRLLKIGYRVVI